ncbi:hypothetical protein J6590_055814 [Homalodisca vitripennis]|nr:hypothetical protein J6590_055814 [Homalodisca vitripennis]
MDEQEIDDALEGHSDCELTDFLCRGANTYHLEEIELDANEVSHTLNIEENVLVTSDNVSLQNAVLYFSQNISLGDELGANIHENNTRSELEEPYQQNNKTANGDVPETVDGPNGETETSTGNDDDGNEWDDIKSTVRQFPYTDNEWLVYDFDISNPVTVLEQFLPDDIINLIVEETNRYAQQDISNNIPIIMKK